MKKAKPFNAVIKINDFLGKAEHHIAVIILLLLVVMCMIFISCRYVFHISTPWSDESARYILISLGWFGGAYCCYHDDHLRINLLSGIIKNKAKNSRTILTIVEIITQLCIGIFMAFFLSNYVRYLVNAVIPLGQVTPALQIKYQYPMYPIVIAACLIVIHSLFKAIILLGRLIGAVPFPEDRLSEEDELAEEAMEMMEAEEANSAEV